MRLSDFILANREPILAEWETFARTCAPASGAMDITALRDHANEMLTAIAADLKTPQGDSEQTEKSKGNAPAVAAEETTAAEEHGAGRAESGFSVEQMVAEFRALRASVIRLWTEAEGGITTADIEDLTRFNEAIDQSLSESVSRYTEDLNQSKEMFLAILSHDLMSPLSAVLMSAEFMLETEELQEPHLTLASRILSSSKRMQRLIGDLLDFTRSRLGGGIPIERAEMSMGKAVQDAVEEIASAHPGRTVNLDAPGEQKGMWDCARITQALTNVIGNAVDHGADQTTVSVVVAGSEDEVTVAVHNTGAPIRSDRLNGIFGPMKSRESPDRPGANNPSKHLGLGLYIAERIVSAHHGRIDVDSSEERGTTFTIRLPRSEGTILAQGNA